MPTREPRDKSYLTLRISIMLAAALIFATSANCHAASNEQLIPDGTVINTQNWQKYREFLPIGVQKMFEGTSVIKLPAEAKIIVGPYISIPPPKKYQADTEHYLGKVSLQETPYGGFAPVNYVAGEPFPNPQEPNKGVKILYDMYYNYKPWRMYRAHTRVIAVDRYGNETVSTAFQVLFRMRHISDVGMPHTLPNALPGVFLTQYLQVESPEEAKYTANLTVFPDDPAKQESVYIYIPTLRRSLRSSSASRCAPLLGGDSVYDDLNGGFNGLPTEFHVKFLGDKRMLFQTPMAIPHPTDNDFYRAHFWFPKTVVGKWDLRPVYILELEPIAARLPGYCYPKKIIYLDEQTLQILSVASYDNEGKLWKGSFLDYYPMPIPNSPGDETYNSFLIAAGPVVDFENNHWSPAELWGASMLSDVPPRFTDIQRYGTPGGLDQILQ